MARLEEIISVPGRYLDITVNHYGLMGSKLVFPNENNEYFLDLLTLRGKQVKSLGQDFQKIRSPLLHVNLNPFYNSLIPFAMVGWAMTFPVQAVYNLMTLPLQYGEVAMLKKKVDYLTMPGAVAASKNRFFVLDNARFCLEGPFRYSVVHNPSIGIFDCDGNAIRKIGEYGSAQGKINSAYLMGYTDLAVFNEKLYVCDAGGTRVQEFDLEGKFIRVMSDKLHWLHGYCDFSAGKYGIYITHDGNNTNSRGWNAVTRIDWQGKQTTYDLSADASLTDGIAVGEEYIYVRDRENILTYTPNMKLVRKDILPDMGHEFTWRDEEHVEDSSVHKLSFFDGYIYFPAWRVSTAERIEHAHCTVIKNKYENVVLKIAVE